MAEEFNKVCFELYGQATNDPEHDRVLVEFLYRRDYDELEADWLAYLSTLEPTPEQAEAWWLKVRSFDLMRRYETELDPDARVLPSTAPPEWMSDTLKIFLGRVNEPVNVVLETALIAAQERLYGSDPTGATALLDDVEAALDAGGELTRPSLQDRAAILDLLAAQDRAILRADADAYRATLTPGYAHVLGSAVEEALRIKEAHCGEVTVVCMGPDKATDAVRKALAMGADNAVLVSDAALAGSDAQSTAYVLAEALKTLEWDLVIFGLRSTDGETGVVPGAVAERLGAPLLSALSKVEIDGADLTVHRETDQGYVTYKCATPAVLSVIKGINEPRYPSMKGIMGAKKKPIDARDSAALGLDTSQVGLDGAKTRVLSGRAPEPRQAGVKIEDDGTGAAKIADFLSSSKLI